MTPIDVLAKVVGKELHHNEPDRPFTDEIWERELRWWRKAKEEAAESIIDISYTMYADKCYRIASATLIALAECELSDELIDGEAEGMIWSTSGDQIDMHRNNFKAIVRAIAKNNVVSS